MAARELPDYLVQAFKRLQIEFDQFLETFDTEFLTESECTDLRRANVKAFSNHVFQRFQDVILDHGLEHAHYTAIYMRMNDVLQSIMDFYSSQSSNAANMDFSYITREVDKRYLLPASHAMKYFFIEYTHLDSDYKEALGLGKTDSIKNKALKTAFSNMAERISTRPEWYFPTFSPSDQKRAAVQMTLLLDGLTNPHGPYGFLAEGKMPPEYRIPFAIAQLQSIDSGIFLTADAWLEATSAEGLRKTLELPDKKVMISRNPDMALPNTPYPPMDSLAKKKKPGEKKPEPIITTGETALAGIKHWYTSPKKTR